MMRNWLAGLLSLVVMGTAACDDPTVVENPRVDRLEIDPAAAVLLVGDTLRITATPRAPDGSVVDDLPIFWQTDNPESGTLWVTGATAELAGTTPGTVRVSASAGDKEALVEVTVRAAPAVVSVKILPEQPVLQVPDRMLVEAIAIAADGSVVEGRGVAWSSSDTSKVSIGNYGESGYGEVSARSAGTVILRAVVDGVSAEVTARVLQPAPAPVASIRLSPPDTLIDVGERYVMHAELRAADGSVITGRPVTWESTNASIATVGTEGAVHALEPGFTTIRAIVGGVSSAARLQVRQPETPVGFVAVRPSQLGIYVDNPFAYGEWVRVLDRSGQPIDRPVSWMVEDSTIASIDSEGTVRGLRAGETRVRAVSGGVSGFGRLVVFAPPTENAQYEFTLDWWDGQFHFAPTVGRTTWTDGTGTIHDVDLFVSSGTLTFGQSGRNTTYERTLVVEGWVWIDFVGRKVVEQRLVDRGTAGIILGGETGYNFFSETRPGHVYQGVVTFQAGQLLVRDRVGTAPMTEYMFRLKQ